jgi:hypothetical protein
LLATFSLSLSLFFFLCSIDVGNETKRAFWNVTVQCELHIRHISVSQIRQYGKRDNKATKIPMQPQGFENKTKQNKTANNVKREESQKKVVRSIIKNESYKCNGE